jgi:hypothetical protein
VFSSTPSSPFCQRWDGGRHSFRHPSEGGFDTRRFDVVPLTEAIAKGFTTRHHYSQSYPAARLAYGLTTDDQSLDVDGTHIGGRALVGVAVLSVPMSSSALSNVFPQFEPIRESIELGRFVLTDTPANAESWFLARVFEHAAAAGIRGVVAFADPMPRHRTIARTLDDGRTVLEHEQLQPGHTGLIYQASNGVACGRSTARTLNYHPASGAVLSERTLSKIRTQDAGAESAERHLIKLGARTRRAGEDPRTWLREALSDVGVSKIRHPGNFRYAWPVGSRAQRRSTTIALPPTPYPKPATDLLPALAA